VKIYEGSITAIASRGHIGVQVPDIHIGGSNTELPVLDLPDAWFVRLNGPLPSERGCLFLTRAGWAANKAAIRLVYEALPIERRTRGHGDGTLTPGTWVAFEAHVEQFYASIDAAVAKRMPSFRRFTFRREGPCLCGNRPSTSRSVWR
jgi:hypothetical protein